MSERSFSSVVFPQPFRPWIKVIEPSSLSGISKLRPFSFHSDSSVILRSGTLDKADCIGTPFICETTSDKSIPKNGVPDICGGPTVRHRSLSTLSVPPSAASTRLMCGVHDPIRRILRADLASEAITGFTAFIMNQTSVGRGCIACGSCALNNRLMASGRIWTGHLTPHARVRL